MSEWKEYKLGGICSKIGSGATPKGGKEAYRGGDTSLIRSQNVLDFSFSWDGLAYINDEQAAKLNGVEIEKGDVLLNITGDSVARACIVPQSALPARVNQHVSIIRGDATLVLNEYILYFLQYKKPYLLSLSKAGATRNALTKGMIEDFPIPLPPLAKQAKIVGILSSLDDKIAINKKICENLEAQAQALFKHWFVDFTPFKDGKFVESELGLIPEGWKVGTLTEIADYLNGLAMQKFPPLSDDDAIPVLKIKELGQSQCDNSSDKCSKQIKPEYIVKNGDVVFSWSGTLMVDIWCGGICGLNQHLFKVTSDNYPKWFYLMWTKHHLAEFIRIAKDKAVTMGHIKRGDLEKAQVAIPDSNTLDKMSEVMNDIFDQIVNTRLENNTLATLRDTLLPKLMSGQIKLNEYE